MFAKMVHFACIAVSAGQGRRQKWQEEGVLRVRKHFVCSCDRLFLRILVKITKEMRQIGVGVSTPISPLLPRLLVHPWWGRGSQARGPYGGMSVQENVSEMEHKCCIFRSFGAISS